MEDYVEQLIPYMDERNREYPSRLYGDLSLDAPLSTISEGRPWCRYDTLIGNMFDESAVVVDQFLKSLPTAHSMIVEDLLNNGLSKASVAKKYNLTLYN